MKETDGRTFFAKSECKLNIRDDPTDVEAKAFGAILIARFDKVKRVRAYMVMVVRFDCDWIAM